MVMVMVMGGFQSRAEQSNCCHKLDQKGAKEEQKRKKNKNKNRKKRPRGHSETENENEYMHAAELHLEKKELVHRLGKNEVEGFLPPCTKPVKHCSLHIERSRYRVRRSQCVTSVETWGKGEAQGKGISS